MTNHRLRNFLTASVLAISVAGMQRLASETVSPSGQEGHETAAHQTEGYRIMALSESEIAGLLSGEGMGYATAAELNGYPGPAHVLELADELNLTAAQRAETEALFSEVKATATELGAELVAAEQRLDEMFRDGAIDEPSLSEAVTLIGRIDSRLRTAHLRAHLRQKQVLNEHQIHRYMMLRGHESGGDSSHHQHSH